MRCAWRSLCWMYARYLYLLWRHIVVFYVQWKSEWAREKKLSIFLFFFTWFSVSLSRINTLLMMLLPIFSSAARNISVRRFLSFMENIRLMYLLGYIRKLCCRSFSVFTILDIEFFLLTDKMKIKMKAGKASEASSQSCVISRKVKMMSSENSTKWKEKCFVAFAHALSLVFKGFWHLFYQLTLFRIYLYIYLSLALSSLIVSISSRSSKKQQRFRILLLFHLTN